MTPSPAEIQGWLVGRVSVLAEVPPADVDVRLPLMYYGLDSASLITLTADLEQWLGHRFRENPLDAHPTIESLSRFLAEQVVRSVLDDQPGSELLRPAVAAAPGRVSDFLLVVLQLALILAIVYRFDLAAQNHLFPILCLAAGGFLVHAWLPPRVRLPFFVLLSLGGIVFYLGWPNGAWVIGLGGGLIAVCYLPIPLPLRVTLIGLAALALVMARMEYDAPFWPVFGSMFMFRLIIYLFEQRRATARPPLALTLAYFFPLPNVCFPFFPILDFQTFHDTYRPEAIGMTARTGVAWIARGLVHLVLYRVVKYHLLPAPHQLGDLPHLALFLATNYALYLHVSGYFHIITGILHLFGFALPRTHDNYFLASSFTDIWRRINIYWKDFMTKVFFFPAYFALGGLGIRTAAAVAALGVFLATWVLHAYQVFWITGEVPLQLYDAGLWLVVGILVAGNLQLDLIRARRHGLRRGTPLFGAAGSVRPGRRHVRACQHLLGLLEHAVRSYILPGAAVGGSACAGGLGDRPGHPSGSRRGRYGCATGVGPTHAALPAAAAPPPPRRRRGADGGARGAGPSYPTAGGRGFWLPGDGCSRSAAARLGDSGRSRHCHPRLL